jgi:thiamine pyrophosphokinase
MTRRLRDQESTDLEKAIRWLLQSGIRRITVAGAMGGRLDHIAGNLSVIGKYSHRADIRAVDDDGELLPAGKERSLGYPPGTTLSLVPLSRCVGVTTHGLRWELRNAALELGVRDGTSNSVTACPATVRVRRGTLLLYRVCTTHAQGR